MQRLVAEQATEDNDSWVLSPKQHIYPDPLRDVFQGKRV